MRSSHISDPAEPLNIIFVHGWGCGWQDWSDVTSLLSDSVQIGLAKLRGCPDAVPLEGAISISDCAAHLIAQANDLGFDRFALVGHSMGARIAVELAANWQERVSHLLLLDGSNVPEDPEEAVARLAEKLGQLGQQEWAEAAFATMMLDNLDRDQKRDLVTRAAKYSTKVLLAYYHAMAAWDCDYFGTAAEYIACPVTIMQSTSLDENEVRRPVTTQLSSLWLDVLRTRVLGAKITLVPDTGHFIMLEQPHLIANWVKDIAQVEHDDHVENQTK
ncbi:MAG: alpha/beta hydrolase [Rhodobacteraceae bacterium]|jgi:pimeloyl-ACP methyl ester carboxylesterase|nr:alpha/beta hydrolase [Paracoccaceae bacterium]MBT6544895.1 alpha/beta hydrolase [Paracoccaceae bacterium]MBT7222642.1 alpha/beta hydrolase [Marinovum sp.]MDG1316335.1 alpha/beta hydrolase [Paracoccaceae bacterium]